MKTFLFAATLPITFPFILYRLFRGDWRGYQNFDPFGSFGGYQQDPRYQQYSTTRQNSGYGRRMEWQYVPGFGWRYVETQYGPDQQGQDNQSYYEDFEDFFEMRAASTPSSNSNNNSNKGAMRTYLAIGAE